jgi:hypothetical protein
MARLSPVQSFPSRFANDRCAPSFRTYTVLDARPGSGRCGFRFARPGMRTFKTFGLAADRDVFDPTAT